MQIEHQSAIPQFTYPVQETLDEEIEPSAASENFEGFLDYLLDPEPSSTEYLPVVSQIEKPIECDKSNFLTTDQPNVPTNETALKSIDSIINIYEHNQPQSREKFNLDILLQITLDAESETEMELKRNENSDEIIKSK